MTHALERIPEAEPVETWCYGTVMCSFALPLAHYPRTDPDLRGKLMLLVGPPLRVGETLCGERIIGLGAHGVFTEDTK